LILGVLCRTLAGHDVTVLSADPAQTQAEHGVAAIPRRDPLAVLGALARTDLLVSGGGGLLQDATGPASVPYYLGIVAAARLLRRPVMVYAQGIGPLRAGWARAALRVLRGARAVTVRDAESAQLLQRAGVRDVEVTADAVLSLPRPDPAGVPEELRAAGIGPGETVLALAPRPYGGEVFTAGLAAAADGLAGALSARVVLVPMQRREDTPACERIAAAMRCPAIVLHQRLPAARYPALFAGFHAVLGMRLHALVLAALCRVPAVGLSYDPKIDAFLRGLGPAGAEMGLDAAPAALAARVRAFFPPSAERAAALDAAVSRLQTLARRNDARLLALLPPTNP